MPAARPTSARRRPSDHETDSGRDDHALEPSGRFLIRIDPGLHAALREAARAEDVSLNEYCARKLAAPTGSTALGGDAFAAVQRAAVCFGSDLLAVAAFGSWARGEEAVDSDVDLLIVVDDRVELQRDLYRRWDDESPRWEGRTIDVHIVHLPDRDQFSPSVWGEVAIDGIVLFERDLVLSRRLVDVRRRIVAGDVVRRMAVGGQPYWVDFRDRR